MSASLAQAIIIDDNKAHDLEIMTKYANNETTKVPLLVWYNLYIEELDPQL